MNRFFKTLLRNIKRNPLYSAINIFGLILGFSCIILIAIWIQNELSYDTFHEKSNEIYRVHRYFYDPDGKENLHLASVAPPVAPILEKEIKEVEQIARVYHTGFTFTKDGKLSMEDEVCFAEPEILSIFSFEGLPDNEELLMEPLTMIISDIKAMSYFNRLDVIGEVIEFTDESGQKHDLRISGVFKKWNQNSHFHPEFLISFITYSSYVGEEEMQDWGSNNYETFALIPHLPADIDAQLDNIIDEYLDNGTSWTKIRTEGLTDIHFNWHSNKSYVFILATISLLILIIGSINYMNLNVAMYSRRLDEIKVRKIMGASQKKLTSQLIAESVLFCLVALTIATWVVWVIVPEFNRILGNPIRFNPGENIPLIIGFILLTCLTGILSVIYPSIVLSSFKPVSIKTNEGLLAGKASFRTGLVVFQFFVSIALIISFMIVFKQLNYIQHKELGLKKENIIVISTTPQLVEKLDVFRQELTSNPNILSVSGSKRVPSNGLWDNSGAEIVSNGEVSPLGFRLANVRADEHFLSTYSVKLIAGRNFDGKTPGYSNFLINESTVRQIGWNFPEEAVGQVIRYGGQEGNVIGVVGDFHYESLHVPISPILIVNDPSSFNRVSIRVTPGEREATLAFIEKVWQKYNIPNYSFFYEYVDDRYQRLYKGEENVKTILTYFMVIAISIAILGLVGLSVFMIQRRVKEIGVRKVNGAKVWEVMTILNKDFVKWVTIAFLLACPIAWYAMNKWLENFAYKTELSWWIFALAGLLALGIALLTVSWQSWKAATRNPVEALRYE